MRMVDDFLSQLQTEVTRARLRKKIILILICHFWPTFCAKINLFCKTLKDLPFCKKQI